LRSGLGSPGAGVVGWGPGLELRGWGELGELPGEPAGAGSLRAWDGLRDGWEPTPQSAHRKSRMNAFKPSSPPTRGGAGGVG
jgi:hypothetical protein